MWESQNPFNGTTPEWSAPRFRFDKDATIDRLAPLGEATVDIDPPLELKPGETVIFDIANNQFGVYGATGDRRAVYAYDSAKCQQAGA